MKYAAHSSPPIRWGIKRHAVSQMSIELVSPFFWEIEDKSMNASRVLSDQDPYKCT